MNCSENTRIATRRAKRDQWFRRMFTVALLVGLAIGFLLGAFTVLMLECSAEEPNQEPSQSTEVQPTQSVIPLPEVTVEPEPEYLGEFRITAYVPVKSVAASGLKTGLMELFMALPVKNWLPAFPVLPRYPLELFWKLKGLEPT